MFGTFFLGALYLQRVLGFDALETGVAFLPVTVIMGALSLRYAERLAMRFGPQRTLLAGLALAALGLAWLVRIPTDGQYVVDVLPTMVLLGTGFGIGAPALMTLAMSGATPQDAGLASGLINTTTQVGGALGLAVLATLAATHTQDAGGTTAAALTDGYRLAFLVSTVLFAIAVAIVAVVLRPEGRVARGAVCADAA
jgi:MFS family permease